MPFEYTFISAPQIDFLDCFLASDWFSISVANSARPTYDHRYLVLFARILILDGLKFGGHFEYMNKQDSFDYAPQVTFSRINFTTMKSATFIKANLESARFLYSAIYPVHFMVPKWPKDRNQPLLYDEKVKAAAVDDDEIRRLYVQLKRSYEENRDYQDAGKWFVREMELRRRAIANDKKPLTRWLRQNIFSWIAWYRNASKYGESYLRSLFVIAGVFLLFGAGIYPSFGIPSDNPYFWDGVLCGLSYSFLVMSFRFDRVFQDLPQSAELISTIHLLVTLILVPLFLLALRRRFRR